MFVFVYFSVFVCLCVCVCVCVRACVGVTSCHGYTLPSEKKDPFHGQEETFLLPRLQQNQGCCDCPGILFFILDFLNFFFQYFGFYF